MRGVVFASRYKKDMKRRVKNPHFRIHELKCVLGCLTHNLPLPKKYCNHKLTGEFVGCFECHIQSDVLLIYSIDEERNILYLLRIGSHAELFE